VLKPSVLASAPAAAGTLARFTVGLVLIYDYGSLF
jgi:hypothetical protein